jgi:hypothetical protein
MAALKARDPMKTKTGKPRLGPLNLVQLEELLAKETRKKNLGKIRNRIHTMKQRQAKNDKLAHT